MRPSRPSSRRSRRCPRGIRLLGLALGVAACTPTGAGPGGAPTPAVPVQTAAAARNALVELTRLRVVPPVQGADYRRARFGDGWADLDHDGCSTRQEILRRDLRDIRTRAGTHGCSVDSGILRDPYSGLSIVFRYGPSTSDDVQIDHVVALADAWRKGARSWSDARREAFANDPLELLAVDGHLNQQKSAKDASAWLPPDPAGRCGYVARQVAIKSRYDLAVTATEQAAMTRALGSCAKA